MLHECEVKMFLILKDYLVSFNVNLQESAFSDNF